MEAKKGTTEYSRKNPYQAKVLQNYNLNKSGSKKETRHLVLSLKGSGFTYESGDCLGVYPQNDPSLIEELLKEMNWEKDSMVKVDEANITLEEALVHHFEVTLLTKKVVNSISKYTNNEELKNLVSIGNEEKLKEYILGRDLLDLLRDFGPWEANAEDILSVLRKMPPRLYSIASSLGEHPEEVHLTIGAVRYQSHGRERKGVCSVQCAERLHVSDTIPVFIQSNHHFHLPESDETDIIMIGPGTGIAPFRSFIEEYKFRSAKGRMWLFFGDQHIATDFLYQNELEEYQKNGVLTKLSTAFSRDTAQKIYVQHKMMENSKELFQWIQNGASIYVCGDKQYMAKDVHNALVEIIKTEGNMSQEESELYVENMKKQNKYKRDVY